VAEGGRSWNFVTSHGVALIRVNESQPMRHPAVAAHRIGEVLSALGSTS
jgi:hypothetical protein